jgi:hypothetical protein
MAKCCGSAPVTNNTDSCRMQCDVAQDNFGPWFDCIEAARGIGRCSSPKGANSTGQPTSDSTQKPSASATQRNGAMTAMDVSPPLSKLAILYAFLGIVTLALG